MRTHRKRWLLLGGSFGLGLGAVLASALAAFVGASHAAASDKPQNTEPPSISGTPEVGKTVTGDKGTWDNKPQDFNYFWVRCSKTGGSCSNISGAHALKYTLTSTDAGNTLRFKVEAVNADGSTFASSVPTAVITKPRSTPSPPNKGTCTGSGTVSVNEIAPPIRLLVDKWDFTPGMVTGSTQTIVARVHIADTCGHSVSGAQVWSTAVPYNQVSTAQATTGGDGYATLTFSVEAGFPANPGRQQILAMLVRASDPKDNPLAGKSTRRVLRLTVRT